MRNDLSKLPRLSLFSAALTFFLSFSTAHAGLLDDLSNGDVSTGLKEALSQGAERAVTELAKADGFLGNPKIKIPLPEDLAKVDSLMRKVRMGKYADELITTMNRAAEAAVPEAKTLLQDAVKGMSIAEAKTILTGPENAATEYFRKHTADALKTKFLPIVEQATQKVKLASVYDNFAGKAAKFGLIKSEQTNLNDYVTGKALDGLYATIAEEEKAIRANPVKRTTSIVQKVFGALIK